MIKLSKMGQTGSNHESNRVKSGVKQSRIMSRIWSNHETNKVDRVEKCRFIGQTVSSSWLNGVESQTSSNH